jgi:hypothetical protein
MTENQTPLNEKYIRLARILEIIPVSRSTWYRGVILPRIKICEKDEWRFSRNRVILVVSE